MISVIIPVFNTEKYLSRCIESVLAQDEKRLEIILVNDGSTDKSPQICDEYANNYDNIMVLHINNSGPATAKNKGLEIATGEYVSFIDSDDAIEQCMYSKMIESAHKNDADAVCCSYRQVDEQGNKSELLTTGKEYVLTQEEAVAHMLLKDKIFSQNWTKIFKTNILKDNKVKFIDGLKTDEDILFNFDAFAHCAVVTIVDEPLYIYTHREKSLARFYVKTNFIQFNENLIMRLDKTQDIIHQKWPNLRKELAIHCTTYYNLLIGRAIDGDYKIAKQYIAKAIKYIRHNASTIGEDYLKCGFSKTGFLLVRILPIYVYYLYRRNKR